MSTATNKIDDALYYADKALFYEPTYQAANLIKAQIYFSTYEVNKALEELYHILDSREYWYDYTPFYAEQMLNGFEEALAEETKNKDYFIPETTENFQSIKISSSVITMLYASLI